LLKKLKTSDSLPMLLESKVQEIPNFQVLKLLITFDSLLKSCKVAQNAIKSAIYLENHLHLHLFILFLYFDIIQAAFFLLFVDKDIFIQINTIFFDKSNENLLLILGEKSYFSQ
jgi:hypothetical protein